MFINLLILFDFRRADNGAKCDADVHATSGSKGHVRIPWYLALVFVLFFVFLFLSSPVVVFYIWSAFPMHLFSVSLDFAHPSPFAMLLRAEWAAKNG